MFKNILKFVTMVSVLMAFTFTFSGCGAAKLSPEVKNAFQTRSMMYTQINMYLVPGKKPHVNSTNYAQGTLIPVNTEVKLYSIEKNVIYFIYKNKKVALINKPQYTGVGISKLSTRYFGSKKVDLSKFTQYERKVITNPSPKNLVFGALAGGMSKKAVIIARGYPPVHQTANFEKNVWKYWKSRGVTTLVKFQNGIAYNKNTIIKNSSNIKPVLALDVNSGKYTFKRNPKENENSFALVIGINEYDMNTNVEYADTSAKEFVKLANITFGIPKENIITLFNSKATSGQIKAKIELIKELADADGNIYIYFAGHGVPGKDGSTYLLPSDMSADSIHLEPNLKLDSIYAKLSTAEAKNVFVFMDSCFSGKDDTGGLLYKGVAPVLKVKKTDVSGKKLTVFTAGKSTDFANDFEAKEQRMFSYFLIKELASGKTDLSKIYSKIRTKVKRASLIKGLGYKQVPQLYGNKQVSLY